MERSRSSPPRPLFLPFSSLPFPHLMIPRGSRDLVARETFELSRVSLGRASPGRTRFTPLSTARARSLSLVENMPYDITRARMYIYLQYVGPYSREMIPLNLKHFKICKQPRLRLHLQLPLEIPLEKSPSTAESPSNPSVAFLTRAPNGSPSALTFCHPKKSQLLLFRFSKRQTDF